MPKEMAWKICKPLPTILVFAILFSVNARSEIGKSCNATREIADKLFSSSQGVYDTPTTDNSSHVCASNNTCCSRELERKFERSSEGLRVVLVSHLQDNIRYVFPNASQNFTGFFQSLIENSYKDLDKLYSRTYSHRYTNHKAIFRHLFTKLGDYLKSTDDIDLNQVVDSWFSILYQKVYMISNPMAVYDPSYQHCILETADTIKPFGDIPRKVGVRIKKSFLASKVLLEAINSAKEVVENLLNMTTHKTCTAAFMKMTHCGFCSNADTSIRPCYNYCINVMKGCSAYPAVVSQSWNTFLVEMSKLATKLAGPFSMETVLRDLGIDISDGIMLFQRDTANITGRVENWCGIPPKKKFKPVKRRSLGEDISYPFNLLGSGEKEISPITAYGTSLARLIKHIKEIIVQVKDYWIAFPENICSSGLAAAKTENDQCWNGEKIDSYTKPIVKDGINGMFKNPEVHLNIADPHLTVTQQEIKLKQITHRILSAASGSDSNQFDLEASGEGSGRGCADEGSGGSGDGSGCPDEGSGPSKPTPWPRTEPTTDSDLINEVETRNPYPTLKQLPDNVIPKGDDNKDSMNQFNNAEVEKSVAVRPPGGGGAAALVGTLSIFTFVATGLLLL